MEIFYLTLRQMLMMFALILIGFLLRKKRIIPVDSDTVMARMETFVFVPALALFTQITKCSAKNFAQNSSLFLYGFLIVLGAILLSYPLSLLFAKKKDVYQRNIYKYALSFGNYGYMGNFIILGVWGNELFYKYTLFTFFVGVLSSSWGLYILVPKENNVGLLANLKKGLLTPPTIAMVLGMLLGLVNFSEYAPDFVLATLENAGNCQGPVAMILAGFVIGGYNFKELILNKKIYIVTFFRLVIIPALIVSLLKLAGASEEMMILALITFATPFGLNTIIYPAAYGGDTKAGAAMTMISHTLSVITIPLMYLIFIVLL